MGLLEGYKVALLEEIRLYKTGEQSEAELMKNCRKHKTGFYQHHEEDTKKNREALEEFDRIYYKFTSNIGS